MLFIWLNYCICTTQLIISSSKASSSFRLSKSQMNTKKVSSTRKRSRKKMVLSNKIVNMTSNKDGSFKKSGSSIAKCTQCNSATQPIVQSTACEPISTNSSYVEIVGNGYGLVSAWKVCDLSYEINNYNILYMYFCWIDFFSKTLIL